MSSKKNWVGYDAKFLDGFEIPLPKLSEAQKKDIALNKETKKKELPFIYYSSIQSKSRKMPFLTAANINRDAWLQSGREGTFGFDDRINTDEQLSTTIYTQLNKKHKEKNKKVDKGHLTRREDVQWDSKKNADKAIEAAKATFYYSNACPQHHQLNNEIWKYLEDAVLRRGHSRKPFKAIVFTGPILKDTDPLLVFPKGVEYKIQCPIRFWKVIYYVNEDKALRCAAFMMSHKLLMERDNHIEKKIAVRGAKIVEEKVDIPFLMFEENEKYQVKLSLLEEQTGLKFKKAKEGLTKDQLYSKLSAKPKTNMRSIKAMPESLVLSQLPVEIEGLVL